MPFTFAHPAIVLPLHKALGNKISLTGLIVGSLMPDFEYFLNMKIQGHYGHTLLGIWWFCLPLGLAICIIFHMIIKRPLINNSPYWVQTRLLPLKQLDWLAYFKKHWFIVCLSIIIGAYSHLFWDAFTHRHGFFSEHLGLTKTLFYAPHIHIPVAIYKVLQHASTLIGAIVLLIYFIRLPKHSLSITHPKRNNRFSLSPFRCNTFWLKVSALALLIFGVRAYGVGAYVGLSIHAYGNIIVSAISATMFAMALVCGYELLTGKNNHKNTRREGCEEG